MSPKWGDERGGKGMHEMTPPDRRFLGDSLEGESFFFGLSAAVK